MNNNDEFAAVKAILLKRLGEEFAPEVLSLWFEPLKIVAIEDEVVFLTAPSKFKLGYIQSKYLQKLNDAFCVILHPGVSVHLMLESDLVGNPAFSEEEVPEETPKTPLEIAAEGNLPFSAPRKTPEETDEEEDEEEEEDERLHALTPEAKEAVAREPYSFENFVVGTSNTMAYAAALAVARQPATDYNPLFIWGPSGLGKTHLLYAIKNYILATRPGTNIVYVKGEEFTNQLIESISLNRMARFRSQYRRADVLLIDDIQFIAGKESTQEEFFHTFNALYEDKKQIILTSDQAPFNIKTLEDRLRSRFVWGMTADIQPPDLELRQAILKKKADAFHVMLPADVLAFLANNLKNNIRQLEGAIKRIGAQALLSGKPISMDIAISCTADMLTGAESDTAVVDRILNRICSKYGISLEDLKSSKRQKQIAVPRHISIYLIRVLTSMSFPAIAKIFGRDHSTIVASYRYVEDTKKTDPVFELEVNELVREMKE